MGLFRAQAPVDVGVLIDVGSASVLVALVASRAGTPHPDIVWSHREHVPLRQIGSLEQSAKSVLTSLMNAALQLDTVGRRVLAQSLPDAPSPAYMQVTIAAPWSYTVTKTITYSKDEPFWVTNELVLELQDAAQKKIELELKEHDVVSQLGLEVITRTTTEVLANGYQVDELKGQNASSLDISRTNAITQRYLADALDDIHDKTFPRAVVRRSSFMLVYYHVIRELYPELSEYCLVDITYEATEIGIVRDGVLRYCTHTPYGAYSLAREIAAIYDTPLEEAYGRMTTTVFVDSNDTEAKRAELSELCKQYEKRIADLFHETGDALSIPKTILLHTTVQGEQFFSERISAGATAATRATHHVLGISGELLKRLYPTNLHKQVMTRHDTAVLISAQFFHTKRQSSNIDW